jgi:transcriptional regulator with XRE-family HTH domain
MKTLKKKINIKVEITKTGYSTYAEELPVYTTGKDLSTLKRNLIESLNYYYEDLGYVVADENLKIHIDLQQFFQHYKVLNSRFLAQKIGMNATLLSQYVRGRKKPSARQTEKILNGIKSIGRELADLQLV